MLRARSIAWASAVKIELSFGRAFLRAVWFKTAAHTALPLSLDPSVKHRGDWGGVGEYCKISLDKCWGGF